jgi:exopolysaccharide biosynthesis polyprenyl glycosylphosphotransferase
LYVFKIQHISRIFIGLVFTFTTLGLLSEKIFYLSVLRYLRRKGYNYRNILIVGTGMRAKKFIQAIKMHSEWGLRIEGLIDKDADMKGKTISGYEVLGIFEDIPRIVHNSVVDEVVFVVPRSWLTNIEELLTFLEMEGIMIHLAVDYFQLSLAKAKQNDLNGFPLLTFDSTPDKIWNLMLKRAIDIAVSLVALIVLSPVMLIISVLVKVTSTGGVFFRQIRCGLNNRKFVLYKFRTMSIDAEKKLENLLVHNQMKGPVFKMDDDPRLTGVGKFLRKLSLDELPQLWNVLIGDMSLVGPRPPIPTEVDRYESWHRRRLSMRPGITCLWQVNGRNAITDFNQWTKLDLDYIDHWSLSLDFKIMLKTIPTVISGAGAK